MSHLGQYGLIIATFISGAFLLGYLTRLHNEAAGVVLIGVMQGLPMSTALRWMWLLQVFLGWTTLILAVDFFLLFAFVKIAGWVDESVAPLAHLGALLWGLAFVGQLVFDASAFYKQASILRQATRS